MTKFYRIGLTAALLGGLALPAFAQTAAPDAPANAVQAPAADAAAPKPAPHATAKKAHRAHHHHVVAQKKDESVPEAGQTKR